MPESYPDIVRKKNGAGLPVRMGIRQANVIEENQQRGKSGTPEEKRGVARADEEGEGEEEEKETIKNPRQITTGDFS